jgi:hypothetical protein
LSCKRLTLLIDFATGGPADVDVRDFLNGYIKAANK